MSIWIKLAILLKVKQQKGQLLEMKHENQYFLFNIGWFLQSATVAEHSPTCISRSHHITLAIAHVYVSGYTSKIVFELYFNKDTFNDWFFLQTEKNMKIQLLK